MRPYCFLNSCRSSGVLQSATASIPHEKVWNPPNPNTELPDDVGRQWIPYAIEEVCLRTPPDLTSPAAAPMAGSIRVLDRLEFTRREQALPVARLQACIICP